MKKEYYGTKKLNGTPMTRGEYNKFRGWTLPAKEDGDEAGYMVEYLDGGKANVEGFAGYISWSPKDVFEASYQENGKMSFGHALVAVESGAKIARSGWNGKGMFVYYVPANSYPAQTGVAKKHFGADAKVPYRAYMAMKTVDNDVVMWTVSQTDALAKDWCIVD